MSDEGTPSGVTSCAALTAELACDGKNAADDAWVALWNGDEAYLPDATGRLAAIVAS